ncbi:hypothetical protein ASPCAL05223 [Aspergillus calidoustus]|uniref:Uncharacterized protein n=1 Tax=Aspergillus calidoustus TaxID=454130 RepID=A0A0U5FX47_ASPCI|nr:hypothetical protein ASPCAL05223 [Aspergillus calidoustus]
MAPRRGGGYGGGGGSSVSCSDSAFSWEGSRVTIAFHALFFLVALVLSIIGSSKAKRAKQNGRPLVAWPWLYTSIVFAIFVYIISIILLVLSECAISYSDEIYPGYIVSNWLSEIFFFILNAVILTSFSKKLHTDFGQGPATLLGVQKGYVVLLLVLMVTACSLETAYLVLGNSDDYSDRRKIYDLVEPRKGIWTTYYTLSVLGILIASGTIVKSVFGGAGFSRPRKLTSWVSALLIGALGFNLTQLGGYVNVMFKNTASLSSSEIVDLQRSQQAVYFLISFFYFVAFYAALEVGAFGAQTPAANPAYAAPGVAQSHNPVYPQHQQQGFNSGYHSGFSSNPGPQYPGQETAYQSNNVEYRVR